jgi:hypothetical protein
MGKRAKKDVLEAAPNNATSQESAAVSIPAKKPKDSHLAEYQWQPGESGNPSGRPKIDLKAEVRAFADEADPKTSKTRLRVWLEMADRRARQGSPKHLEMLLSYGWGKPSESIKLDADIKQKEIMAYEDADEIIRHAFADPLLQMRYGVTPVLPAATPTNGHSTPQDTQTAAAMPDQDLSTAREDDTPPIEEGRPAGATRPTMRVRVEL